MHTQGRWVFAISPARPWRRRIAGSQGTLRVAFLSSRFRSQLNRTQHQAREASGVPSARLRIFANDVARHVEVSSVNGETRNRPSSPAPLVKINSATLMP